MTLGQLLKRKRKKLRLGQKDVSKALNYTAQFVSNWERDISRPPIHATPKLCETLQISRSMIEKYFIKDVREDFNRAWGK